MSYHKKKNRTFLWKWTVRCNKLAGLGLIFSLLLMLAFLSLSLFYDEIHIPERILIQVREKLSQKGIRVTYDDISMDFLGNVTFDNATIYFIESEEPAINSERLYVNINYAAIMIGRMPIDEIRLSDADLYSPAMLSPSGTTDYLIKDLDLGIRKQWGNWELYHFIAEINDLKLSANGDLTTLVKTLINKQPKQTQEPNLYLDYLKLCKQLVHYLEPIRYLDTPTLTLTASSPNNETFSVTGSLSAQTLSGHLIPHAENIKANFEIEVFPEFKQITPLTISAETAVLESQQIKAQSLYLELKKETPITSTETLFPCKASITMASLEVKGETIFNVTLAADLQSKDDAKVYISSNLYDGTVNADLDVNWKDRTANGQLRGAINVTPIFNRPEISRIWKLKWPFQNELTYLDTIFSSEGTLETTTAEFQVYTTHLNFIKTYFDRVLVQGTLDGTFLDAYNMETSGHGNSLKSTFRKDLNDPYYDFTTIGYMRPSDLNYWWKDWWTRMFGKTEFTEDIPWFDIAVNTAFIYKKQLTLFGHAEAKNFKLMDMDIDRVSTQLFVRPNYADIYKLTVERPEGTANGQFQRELVQKKMKNVIVDVRSTVDLEESLNLFGDKGRKLLEPYSWMGNPALSLKGEFNFENDTKWQDLEIVINTDSPMTYYGFPIDTLFVESRYDHGNVYLDNIQFEFAEGIGEAQVTMLRENDYSYLIYDLELFDAELGETLQRLKDFQKKDSAEVTSDDPKAKSSKAYEGKIHLHATGFAPSGTGLKQIHAMGNFDITEGNLVQIPLFGAISSLFPGTKLSLNDFSSSFTWNEDTLHLPDLIMRGASARLEGAGNYHPSNTELNFQVKLFLLKESENVLFSGVLAPLLTPLSHMGTVNLKGTLAKPLWRFSFSPLNLLDSQNNLNEEGSDTSAIPAYEFRK